MYSINKEINFNFDQISHLFGLKRMIRTQKVIITRMWSYSQDVYNDTSFVFIRLFTHHSPDKSGTHHPSLI